MDRATSPRPSARPAAASAAAAAAAAAATSAMGASVTKCLGSQCDDLPAAPPRPAGPPPSARTFDLEELGLLAAPAAVRAAERSVEVAYEHEGVAAIPHRDHRARRRPVVDACAPDACAPLDKSASASTSASTSGRPRGRLVAAKEPSKPSADDADRLSTSATDNEDEDERCSKTHKLCMCELRRHRAADDCWLAAYGNVYDVTGILRAHPGGARSLLRKAGGPDCSSDMDFHTRKARRMMDHCFVGKLQPCGDDADAGQANCSIM